MKQMQLTLKVAMKKVENHNFDLRLGVVGHDPMQLVKFRDQCKNIYVCIKPLGCCW